MAPPPYIYASSLTRRERARRTRRRRVAPLELALSLLLAAGSLAGVLAGHLLG
jgi:hypothetical protein